MNLLKAVVCATLCAFLGIFIGEAGDGMVLILVEPWAVGLYIFYVIFKSEESKK